MASRGRAETDMLRQNLEEQLERLVKQLADLEECKDDLEEAEYAETKTDTIEQLKELNESLSKMISGDMTLVDHLGSMQLATQAAISAAFRTPAIIGMFARREPQQLIQRLCELERDAKLGKVPSGIVSIQKVEILTALQQLGTELSVAQLRYLEENSKGTTPDSKNFEQVSESSGTGAKALAMASEEARTVEKS